MLACGLAFVAALALGQGGCCWSGSLTVNAYLPEVESILDRDLEQNDRVALYGLPSCCWPEEDDTERDELLPGRAEGQLLTGLDALALDDFALLRNRNFALLTNSTSRDRNLKSGLELMVQANVRPALIFEPEHGLYGHLDAEVESEFSRETRYGLRVLSLYSARRKRPEPRHLAGIDLIVVDIENLPVRCYTYVTTLTYLLESANDLGIEVLILDRPNPYGFWQAQGGFLQEEYRSFIGEAPTPFLYSMTPGEYARYMVDARFPDLRLSVLKVANYERAQVDAPLRRSWINPSPNIPGLESALVYPGMVFFEGVEFSVGRGTTRPFTYSGAPWLDSATVVAELRALNLPGVEITEVTFQPSASVYRGQTCRGVQLTPVSTRFDPLRTGYEYMRIVRRLHPNRFRLRRAGGLYWIDRLWGGPAFRESVLADLPYDQFASIWQDDARIFEELVAPYRMY